MATEAQITQIERAIGDLQARKEHCCREIVTWRSYVRVIAENTGIVLSDWLENMQVGAARRGEQFTVEFSLPHDSSRYLDDRSSTLRDGSGNTWSNFEIKVTPPGKAESVEAAFYNLAILQPREAQALTSGQTATYFYSQYWLGTSNTFNTIIEKKLGSTPDKPLPQTSSDGYYRAYKDADNKIKVDVIRGDQYATNEYLALFFTQFVQRLEYS